MHYWEDKLNFALDYLNYGTKRLAEELCVSTSTVSQWRSSSHGKLKKMHLFAIEKVTGIPYVLFENNNINTQEKVKEFLDKYQEKKQNIDFDDGKVLKSLVGKWYCYNYSSSIDLGTEYWEDIIEIKEDKSAINYNEDNTIYAEGEIFISQWQTTITLYRNNIPINITFENSLLTHESFYAFLMAKAKHTSNVIAEFVIFTRNKLTSKQVMYALGDRRKNQTIIDEDAKARLRRVIYNDNFIVDRYDPHNILNNHLGTWHINNFSSKKKHTITINANFSVEWRVDGAVDSVGKFYIHEHDILIILEDARGIRSYLLLNITEQDVKLCCLKSRAAITHKDIFVVGIMSKDELPKEKVQEILESNEKSYINITYLRDRLWKSMEES